MVKKEDGSQRSIVHVPDYFRNLEMWRRNKLWNNSTTG